MVSVPLARETQAPASPPKLSWQPAAWFGALLLLCYAPILYRLAVQWANDEDMGHGFFVPLVAGFIVWQRRDILAKIPPKSNGCPPAPPEFLGL